MTKEIFYNYLGVNGIITSSILLEGVPAIKKIKFTADRGKVLTKDGKTFCSSITVPESEVALWSEVLAEM